tara:strand:+ start:2251 stop:2751 length:501 start_codon:yes stop_codon:yes gene_type:complete
MITLRKTDFKDKVTENFTVKEWFSKSADAPDSHLLDYDLCEAVQVIRDMYNTPIRINSTLRTLKGNQDAGGSPQSNHLTGHAVDFSFISESNEDIIAFMANQWTLKGMCYQELRGMRASVIFYPTFIHIDFQEGRGFKPQSIFTDEFGTYGFGNSVKKKYFFGRTT